MTSKTLLSHLKNLFYLLILNAFHLYYTIHTAIRHSHFYIKDFFARTPHQGIPTPDTVRHDTRLLSKVPGHLAILILNEEGAVHPSDEEFVHDVAQLACYCSSVMISELTIYESTGSLKQRETHLKKEIYAARQQWESCVVERNSYTEASVHNKPKASGTSAVKLNIYSVDDGINHLVDLTRSLITAVQSGAVSSKDIDVPFVDKFVRDQNFTEPNLMIVIGGTPHKFVSLEGFPPWHVRLTEIVNMSGHDRIDYSLFLSSLYRYSKVEQRFGR